MLQWKLLGLCILFISVILHEVAHGYAALYFGDDTAKRAGRLTLDPMAHIDLFGTIIIPFVCVMMGGPIFGWAKPVPVNFDALPGRKAELCVSLAGVAVNLLIAVMAGLGIRGMNLAGISDSWPVLDGILMAVIYLNLMLAVFNMMPVPPLDGWRIWGVWLPYDLKMRIESYAMLAMVLLFVLLPFLMSLLVLPLIKILLLVIAGVKL